MHLKRVVNCASKFGGSPAWWYQRGAILTPEERCRRFSPPSHERGARARTCRTSSTRLHGLRSYPVHQFPCGSLVDRSFPTGGMPPVRIERGRCWFGVHGGFRSVVKALNPLPSDQSQVISVEVHQRPNGPTPERPRSASGSPEKPTVRVQGSDPSDGRRQRPMSALPGGRIVVDVPSPERHFFQVTSPCVSAFMPSWVVLLTGQSAPMAVPGPGNATS